MFRLLVIYFVFCLTVFVDSSLTRWFFCDDVQQVCGSYQLFNHPMTVLSLNQSIEQSKDLQVSVEHDVRLLQRSNSYTFRLLTLHRQAVQDFTRGIMCNDASNVYQHRVVIRTFFLGGGRGCIYINYRILFDSCFFPEGLAQRDVTLN